MRSWPPPAATLQGLALSFEFFEVIEGRKPFRDLALILLIGFGIEHRELDRMARFGLPGPLIVKGAFEHIPA